MLDENDGDEERRCRIVSSHHGALLLDGGARSRSITWRQCDLEWSQRNEKISNSSSFGIIDVTEDSSTTDRIIVIVKMACFIHDGARR